LKIGDLVKIRKPNCSFANIYFDKGIIIKLSDGPQLGLYEFYRVFNFTTKQMESVWEGAVEVISLS
tara:strand:- start:712 stop:909 length:198 start_codon:yes stop_codon:yes gene_type:complete